MKKKIITVIASLGIGAVIVTGCKLIGSNPSPPTQFEQRSFDITTNYTPEIVTKTNVVTTTNVVNVPSPFGVPIFQTNFVTSTNVVTLTNQVPDYQYVPKSTVVDTTTHLGNAVAPFTAGWGSIISGALVGLYGLWAHLRSTKKGATASALTQEIEAIRDFILTLPQGTKIDTAVTTFMQQHQVETGVAQEVLKLIEGNTSDPTAIGIAKQLQEAIDALTNPTTPKV